MTKKTSEIFFEKLEKKLNELDTISNNIWSLNYKDFEDLKWATKVYEDEYLDADDLLTEIEKLLGIEECETNERFNSCEHRVRAHEDKQFYYRIK